MSEKLQRQPVARPDRPMRIVVDLSVDEFDRLTESLIPEARWSEDSPEQNLVLFAPRGIKVVFRVRPDA